MSECEWQFHGVSRTDVADGKVRIDLNGWRYTTNEERRADPDGPAAIMAAEPCASVTVPERWTEWDGKPVQVVESADAAALVSEHCGAPYTVVWQGTGWTVEIKSGYPLWQTTG